MYAFFLYWNFGIDKLICGLFFMNSKTCEKKIFFWWKSCLVFLLMSETTLWKYPQFFSNDNDKSNHIFNRILKDVI